MAADALVIAIDSGGSNTRVEAREGERNLGMLAYETPKDYGAAMERVAESAGIITAGKHVDVIGCAVAGQVDGNRIMRAGQLQEYGWGGQPIRRDLARAFNLDLSHVVVLNDCTAAAKAQQASNKRVEGPNQGYVITLGNGFGGAGFNGSRFVADEPGHEFLKPGAVCACGREGCNEAHVSGSGILNKFGVTADKLPDEKWREVVEDLTNAHLKLLERLKTDKGLKPETLYYFGGIATKSPFALPGLAARLARHKRRPKYLRSIKYTAYRDYSALVGAGDAAAQLAARSYKDYS